MESLHRKERTARDVMDFFRGLELGMEEWIDRLVGLLHNGGNAAAFVD